MKRFTALLLCILFVSVAFTGCQKKENNDNEGEGNMEKVYATIEFEGFGTVKLELYPEIAPQSVYNFVSLARKGFYNGLTIHRIVPGFVIQGGDPEGNGMGGPGYCIKGEFNENGVKNELKHDKGVISWARTPDPDSAGSQFFIVLEDSPNNHYALDNKYAGFGKVIEGMDVVTAVAAVEKDRNDCPITPVVMKTVTIEGPELPEPDKLPGR